MDNELKKFVEACIAKGEAEELGDSKTGNKQYKVISKVYMALKENNRITELLVLLNHENPYVRLWAAGYTLQILDSRAESVLEELSLLRGLIGFNSKMTLSEWRKGNLKF